MSATAPPTPPGERLNKTLARAGVASRRAADEMIRTGRVTVNGQVITELGTRVDPERDAIKVDGRRIAKAPDIPVYYMLHKPKGYVTTMSDPEGRPTVKDLLRGVRRGVFPVGRLDFHSEGLLMLTDDGELARDLLHPRKEVPRTYHVKVHGRPERALFEKLRRGVFLEGRATGPIQARMLKPTPNSWCEITVREGRKHLVRNLMLSLGHPVVKLRRVAYGGVSLADLPAGRLRALTDQEVSTLKRAASGETAKPPPKKRPGRRN